MHRPHEIRLTCSFCGGSLLPGPKWRSKFGLEDELWFHLKIPGLTRFDGISCYCAAMAQAVGYTADLSIDSGLAQLLRLRVAQLNPCSYCLICTARPQMTVVSALKDCAFAIMARKHDVFDAERSALAYCEALTAYDPAVFRPTCRACVTL